MSHEDVQQVLDWAVAEAGVPGIIAEVHDADGTWFGTAGVADLGTGAPRQRGEHVHAGSGGKAFTAATVLQLEVEGRLSLDDTVEKWLPGVMDVNGYDGRKVTIRHLLSNTGGLFSTGLAPETTDNYATRSGLEKHRFDHWTTADLIRLGLSQPPIGEPGERFVYSNSGYYLAGAIIEKVTGNSYAEEVDRAVVQPLGLTHTFVRASDDTGYPEPHPRAYTAMFLKDGVDPASLTADNWTSLMEEPGTPPLDVTEFNTSLFWSAGNVVSTTGELIRFIKAMASGSLLPPAQHHALWTTVSTEGSGWIPHTRYGLGMFELEKALTGGLTLRGMAGAFWGTGAFGVSTPDGERAVVLHTNTDWRDFELAFKVIDAVFGTSLNA
ncbi:serine hydrolase domain-containing protein [Saccharothrix australiensis]|uniref:D-alanyl-D-alanine carboxypeptidase n=1 Tax=Saccharothrix australiensis TaxID=2072 RepID=A0A495W314_9PSEU|nr:serine hydrolase domain-containing protein [Saccharothrix australiensis]RKT54218.1 D-alanyl-D-alanine carboxypeptidase [Saccharothrix australiensis]